MNRFQCLLIAGAMMLLSGCHSDSEVSKVTDESSTQADPAALAMLGELEVTDALGEKRMVADFSQGKNLVVVVSRGYYGSVCPLLLRASPTSCLLVRRHRRSGRPCTRYLSG